jgi:hypothetical protein
MALVSRPKTLSVLPIDSNIVKENSDSDKDLITDQRGIIQTG